jgi:hypothetical protein
MTSLVAPYAMPSARGLVANHLRAGLSTGAMAEQRGDWPALVEAARGFSGAAVELAALSGHELPGLAEFLDEDPWLPFRFVSVHAPTKRMESGDRALAAALAELPPTVDAIVLHPDTLAEPAAYRALGRRAVLENMDARKAAGTTVEELEAMFELLPEAGFCLDVAHVWSLDPTMALGHELLDAFRLRLTHVHVSSVTAACEHVPLTPAHEALFGEVLERCVDVPWILEAV